MFKDFSLLIATSIAFLFASCSDTRSVTVGEKKVTDLATRDQYTLNSTPNSLDRVGTIIGIDSKGFETTLPGGNLDLPFDTGTIAIPQVVETRDINLGFVGHFLSSATSDTTLKAAVEDTSHFKAEFKVQKGTLSKINGDLAAAFEKKRDLVERNIKFLELEKNKFYLILETITSNDISIKIDKSQKFSGNIFANITKWLGLNPNLNKAVRIDKDLVYIASNPPVVVMYKLRKVNLQITGTRGDNSLKVAAVLGNDVSTTLPEN